MRNFVEAAGADRLTALPAVPQAPLRVYTLHPVILLTFPSSWEAILLLQGSATAFLLATKQTYKTQQNRILPIF